MGMSTPRTKLTEVNRKDVGPISREIIEAAEGVAKKHGLKLSRKGNITYDKNGFHFKVSATLENIDPERDNFIQYAPIYGLDPKDYRRTFKHGQKEYRIVGINTRAHAYPIIVETVNRGDRFKMPASQVKMAMGKY